jgi:peptide/nickel transport system substrate-binding protein
VHVQHRTARRRPGVALATVLAAFALVAGACGGKKGTTDEVATADTDPPASASETPDTEAQDTGGDDTTAPATADTEAPAVTEPAEEAKTPIPGGTLIVSGEAEVANPWTPAAMQCDSYCQQRARTIFDPLVAIGDDGEAHPVLLESFEPNDDFTVWTFKMREGIKFHDGTDVDAAAAVKNLQLTGTGLLVSKALVDVAKNADGSLAIEVVDPLTFTIATGLNGDITQPVPWPTLPLGLAGQLGLIASPTWLDAAAADPSVASAPVGSGPFIYESYAPRDRLVVKRNPDYWQTDANGVQLPYLDGIEFRVIEDSEIAADALRSGDLDIFSTSAAQVIADFREEADEFPMAEQTDFVETNYFLIDLDKPGPLQDKRVRCALSKAIDRQEIIDAVDGGILEIANGLFSPGQEGYLEDNGFDTAQDIEGATAMIAEYEAETGEEVSINYGATTSQVNAQLADLLEGYWNEIGVDFEFQQVPQDSFITDALFGNDNFFMFGWRNHAGLYIDQQNFWWNSASAAPDGELALNFGRVRDPIVDENLAIARSSTDPAERQAAAEAVNRQMAAECYQIPRSFTLWGTPHLPKVQGLGTYVLPDGSAARDGAGFSGQFWVNSLWIDPEA